MVYLWLNDPNADFTEQGYASYHHLEAMDALHSCFVVVGGHQQCIPGVPELERRRQLQRYHFLDS